VSNEWKIINWNGYGRKQLWLSLRYIPVFTRRDQENYEEPQSGQLCPGTDLNWALNVYKSKDIIT
jgi:hypothetical protein